ncbi:deoxyribose-phosphate aldolase [Spongiimicrobium sp. 3-5]|uniref:deoxyribose-phosphate aldolase n=1 Tax=Spongiimicrobium sp. 3-5 TaxID=3332596 RepID=UPI00397F683F
MRLNNYIDHTLLKPVASTTDIVQLCEEAKIHNFYAVCVNGCHLPLVKKQLVGTQVKIAAVIGFPLGATSTKAKICEAKICIAHGADEIDMVINLGWLKSGKFNLVLDELKAIKTVVGNQVLKVIIETCYLTQEEKIKACGLVTQAKADFIKTSTGFGSGGATVEDIELMRQTVGNNVRIKASGGIKDAKTALRYIDLGVDRIGTSSGVAIVLSELNL